MDKSLDDMIKTTRKRGGRRRTVRANVLGNTAANAAKGAAKKAGVAPTTNGSAPLLPQSAQKIIVSGLPLDVDEAQIKELFTTGIGPLKKVQLNFDPHGRWNGSATIIFSRKGDGVKAYDMYNNRLIDGKKPMKVELILEPSPPTLASRVAPAAKASGGAPANGAQRVGRPRRARGPRAKKEDRPQKSAEDLDAEMEDYTSATNAPAAVAASTA